MLSLRAAGSFPTRTQNQSGWNFPRGDVNVRAAVWVVNCEIMIQRQNVVEENRECVEKMRRAEHRHWRRFALMDKDQDLAESEFVFSVRLIIHTSSTGNAESQLSKISCE
jgi:hypothetical protein